jgi:hypothetical protein
MNAMSRSWEMHTMKRGCSVYGVTMQCLLLGHSTDSPASGLDNLTSSCTFQSAIDRTYTNMAAFVTELHETGQ